MLRLTVLFILPEDSIDILCVGNIVYEACTLLLFASCYISTVLGQLSSVYGASVFVLG